MTMAASLPVCARGRAKGTATIEFAVMAPLILLLLAAVLDFSVLLRTATCAANAARVGSEYGSRTNSAATDYSGMQNAAVNSAPGVSGMTASATRTCQCSGGGTVSCTGTCAGGSMQVYVQVTVQAPAHTIFDYSALSVPGSVTAQASMRVQ